MDTNSVRDALKLLEKAGVSANGPHGQLLHWGDLFLALDYFERTGRNVLAHLILLRKPVPLTAFYTIEECERLIEVQSASTPWPSGMPDDLADALERSLAAHEFEAQYRTRRAIANRHISNAAVRERIIERDGRSCNSCGESEFLAIDHIVSVRNGGSNDDSNLQVLCRDCNSSKGSK